MLKIDITEQETFFRKEEHPVPAHNAKEWGPLFTVFDSLNDGEQWLGYDVKKSSATVTHTAFYMGRKQRNIKHGAIQSIVLTGGGESFIYSCATRFDAASGVLDVRATSAKFMDTIFIVAKSSL